MTVEAGRGSTGVRPSRTKDSASAAIRPVSGRARGSADTAVPCAGTPPADPYDVAARQARTNHPAHADPSAQIGRSVVPAGFGRGAVLAQPDRDVVPGGRGSHVRRPRR